MSGVPPSATGSPYASLISATSYTIGQPDMTNVLVFTASSAIAVSLPAPGTSGDFARGLWVEVVAGGSGAVTVTPLAPRTTPIAPTINGSTTLSVAAGSSAVIFQDLSGNWRGVVSISSAGSGGITQLTGAVIAGPGSGSQAATITFGSNSTTAVAGAATLNTAAGVVTSEALSGATTYTLTLTNSQITATSTIHVSPFDGATTGVQVTSITPSTGQVVIVLAMVALTGTVKIPFAVFN